MARRTRFPREHWEELCKRNGHSWVLGHNPWVMMWGDEPLYGTTTGSMLFAWRNPAGGTLHEDELGRGFAVTCDGFPDAGSVEIWFALVDEPHRRKGVMRALVERIAAEHPKRRLVLESIRAAESAWPGLGFEKIGYRDWNGHVVMIRAPLWAPRRSSRLAEKALARARFA